MKTEYLPFSGEMIPDLEHDQAAGTVTFSKNTEQEYEVQMLLSPQDERQSAGCPILAALWLSGSRISSLETGQPDERLGSTAMNLLPTPTWFGHGEKGQDDEQK